MTYDNTNRWTLNKVTRKENPKHADYKGKVYIEDKLYWIDGWIKEGPTGKFISGTVKAAQPRREDPISTGRPMPAKRSVIPDDMAGDDIPF